MIIIFGQPWVRVKSFEESMIDLLHPIIKEDVDIKPSMFGVKFICDSALGNRLMPSTMQSFIFVAYPDIIHSIFEGRSNQPFVLDIPAHLIREGLVWALRSDDGK